MSLHTLANHLQQAGRGQDKMLVHMTPKEVGGLQALAMAHGGSLTVNPQTGLPEAGFLSSILPAIAGFALGPAGMALMTPMQAALTVGAVGTLATGSLSKGLMAGLGAYGGAGIGGALMGAGGAGATAGKFALAEGLPSAVGLKAPGMAGFAPSLAERAASGAASLAAPAAPAAAASATPALAQTSANILKSPMLTQASPGVQGAPFVSTAAVPAPQMAITPQPPSPYSLAQPKPSVPIDLVEAPTPPVPPARPEIKLEEVVKRAASGDEEEEKKDTSTFGGRMSAVSKGLKEITSDPKKLMKFVKENPYEAGALGLSLYAGMQPEYNMPSSANVKPLEKYRYVYDRSVGVPGSSSAERDYYSNARYEPTGEYYRASGGLMALANGGPVEDMSRLNAIGANTGYPMANQNSSTYASPAERPISENIIRPQGDANVDPYTGEQRFADGGVPEIDGVMSASQAAYYYGPGVYAHGLPRIAALPPEAGGTNTRGTIQQQQAAGLGTSTQPGSEFFDYVYNPTTGGFDSKSAPAAQAPSLSTQKQQYDQAGLNKLYQQYFGRDIDPSGLASYTGRQFSPAELDTIFKQSEEYKSLEPVRAAKEREAKLATPEQIADIYERKLGRIPDLQGLEYYAKQNRMTPEELEKELTGSREYFENLAKPFVPAISYSPTGQATIEGAPTYNPAQYGFAGGGLSNLGDYSDGGRLLKGPGDGVSDSIPAVIGSRQPARLADGEFVIPARIVSELGNGSTDAGARKLYAMMDRIQSTRRKSVGKGKVAVNSKADKHLPA